MNWKARFQSIAPINVLLAFSFCLFFAVIIRRAWVSDDAFITFRTIDNFLHGYGLTWNPGERVQSYTHPAWMLLLAIAGLFTRGELVFTSILLSIILTSITLLILIFRISVSRASSLFLVFTLILSNAFIDYSTSGLENSLSHLLLVIFLMLYTSLPTSPRKVFWLSFIAASVTLNRLDLLLLLLPALIYTLLELGKESNHNRSINCGNKIISQGLPALILGFLPLFIWEAFSLIYYGFPFPNTAYAKLNTGIPSIELFEQGFRYLSNSIHSDPITLTIICSAILLAFLSPGKRMIPQAIGIILYLFYVVKIGGDFMSGRFLAAPFLVALVVLARFDLSGLPKSRMVLIFAVTGVLGLLSPNPTLNFREADLTAKERSALVHSSDHGIANERQFYYPTNGLLRIDWKSGTPQHPYAIDGLAARDNSPAINRRITVGMFGYYAGPQVYVVDVMGLGDALLARLPAQFDPQWRIGHFQRTIPAGYLDSLASGQNLLNDMKLAEYYDQLMMITHSRLFDPARLIAIWKMNTGQFQDLIDFDEYRFPK